MAGTIAPVRYGYGCMPHISTGKLFQCLIIICSHILDTACFQADLIQVRHSLFIESVSSNIVLVICIYYNFQYPESDI